MSEPDGSVITGIMTIEIGEPLWGYHPLKLVNELHLRRQNLFHTLRAMCSEAGYELSDYDIEEQPPFIPSEHPDWVCFKVVATLRCLA